MNKIQWENYQDGDSTPLSAENLNLMQDNIEEELGKKAYKTYVDSELNLKSDITYVDSELNLKANQITTYTKSEVDNELDKKEDKYEIITNANGTAHKYTNGKLVCYGEATGIMPTSSWGSSGLYRTSSANAKTATFPISFISPPQVFLSGGRYDTLPHIGSAPTNTDVRLGFVSAVNNVAFDISYQAIGRWK